MNKIYKDPTYRHDCPCQSLREIQAFTVDLIRMTRPSLHESLVKPAAEDLVHRALYELKKLNDQKGRQLEVEKLAADGKSKKRHNGLGDRSLTYIIEKGVKKGAVKAAVMEIEKNKRFPKTSTPKASPSLKPHADEKKKRQVDLNNLVTKLKTKLNILEFEIEETKKTSSELFAAVSQLTNNCN